MEEEVGVLMDGEELVSKMLKVAEWSWPLTDELFLKRMKGSLTVE